MARAVVATRVINKKMFRYKLFNANIIKILEFAEMMNFYKKHEQASPIVNYLKTNKFNLVNFKNFLSILSKRNAYKTNHSLQYSYKIKIKIVEDIIIIQEKIFNNTFTYVQEHVFYCEYLFSLLTK